MERMHGSRTQHLRLYFQKVFLCQALLAQHTQILREVPGLQALFMCALWLRGPSLGPSDICKRLSEKQQHQSARVLNVQVCIIFSSSEQGITVFTLSSSGQHRWRPLSHMQLSQYGREEIPFCTKTLSPADIPFVCTSSRWPCHLSPGVNQAIQQHEEANNNIFSKTSFFPTSPHFYFNTLNTTRN